jgi:predicted transcriptional regulator
MQNIQSLENLLQIEEVKNLDMSKRENRVKRFDLVKRLEPVQETLDISNNKLATLVGLSPTSVSTYKRFDNYDEYCEAQIKRTKKYKTKEVQEEVKTLDKKENDLWFENMLNEAQKTNSLLLEIKELLIKKKIIF